MILRKVLYWALATAILLGPAYAKKKDRAVMRGRVALADGTLPQLLVDIERVCNGTVEMTGYADSEGRFTVDFGSEDEASHCSVRAKLPGYRSSALRPADANESDLGTLVLSWRGKDDAAARSARNRLMTKPAWQEYENGLNEAAKGKIHDAEDSFQQASKIYPWASSPFLARAVLEHREGHSLDAEKLYSSAITTEEGYLLPYAYLLPLEISRQEWASAMAHAKKVISIDPDAFPVAWFASAQAALNLHDLSVAEESARRGIALDQEHEYPELEYVLALALDDKGDHAGAAEHLKAYLALDPKGASAQAAREQLATVERSK